jgi:uncharacterized protein YukE
MSYEDGTFELEKELAAIEKVAQEIANKFGHSVVELVKKVEKGIKTVVGSYPDLVGIVHTLEGAQDPIASASSYVGQTKIDLPNAWQGTASQVYSSWLTTVENFTDDLNRRVQDGKSGIAYEVQQLADAIVHIYQSFVTLVATCCVAVEKALGYGAADLADATGGTFKMDPAKVGDATADMIKDAADAMVTMESKYIDTMNGLLTTWRSVITGIQDITSSANSLHRVVAAFS